MCNRHLHSLAVWRGGFGVCPGLAPKGQNKPVFGFCELPVTNVWGIRMQHGFSLVELSIVLVILGLLTGSVLTGQSLIRAAELRAVTSEYQRYITAVNAFRSRYAALPGDMPDASRFWGSADGGDGMGSDCFYFKSTDQATCNGNGDGMVSYPVSHSMESFRFWQHLASAGLIEGSYTGAPGSNSGFGSNSRYAKVGENIPSSRLTNAAWHTEFGGTHDGSTWGWAGTYGHIFIFGTPESNDITEVAALKPEEAWNIDVKLDDGKPAFGSVRTSRLDEDCHSTTSQASAANAAYSVSSNAISCFLIFTRAY